VESFDPAGRMTARLDVAGDAYRLSLRDVGVYGIALLS
jgi:hypothetical protein